ncbi:MAG: hypothetical protein HZB39_10625 [Planctomycetes bacterium]|nr:hypothetical protein [Planctomycetota bacterium]
MNRPTFSFAGLLAATLACCTTDVPVGFDSGTSQASRDVVASPGSIVEAARAVLYELGDAVETVVDGERTTLRTGRARIVVAARGAGTTRLEVFVMRYVGPDHASQAAMLLDRVVRRIG